MRIYRAIRINNKTQGFGDNVEFYFNKYGLTGGHNGFDWGVSPCSEGYADTDTNKCSPIYFDLDIEATLIDLSLNPTFGLGIYARSEDKDGIFEHRWWHFQSLNPDLKVGQKLESGDLLGWGGSTGFSSGPHLHRDIQPQTRRADGTYYDTLSTNGYGGCVDLAPYFINIYIKDQIANLMGQISILQKMVEIMKKILAIQIIIKAGK